MLLEWGIKGSSGWAEASPPWVRVRFLGQAGPYYAGPPCLARPIPRPGAFALLRGPGSETCPYMMGAWSLARATLLGREAQLALMH